MNSSSRVWRKNDLFPFDINFPVTFLPPFSSVCNIYSECPCRNPRNEVADFEELFSSWVFRFGIRVCCRRQLAACISHIGRAQSRQLCTQLYVMMSLQEGELCRESLLKPHSFSFSQARDRSSLPYASLLSLMVGDRGQSYSISVMVRNCFFHVNNPSNDRVKNDLS